VELVNVHFKVRTRVKFVSHNGYLESSVTHSCLRNPISDSHEAPT